MSKKLIVRRVEWFMWNGATVILVICGLVFQMEMAANAFKFLAWFDGITQILTVCSNDAIARKAKDGPAMPPRLTLLIDLSVAALLAAYGWFGYATLVAVGGLCSVAPYCDHSSKDPEAEPGAAD